MKINIRQNNAITLIALVITIIVLLILAGIAIASLTGDNGLLARTVSAKEETEKASAREQIETNVLASYGTDGKLSYDATAGIYDLLTKYVGGIDGLTDKNGSAINETNPIKTLPITVKLNGFTYKIASDGSVENKKQVVLPEGIKVGDAVTYEPTGNTYTWRGKYATIAKITTTNGVDTTTEDKVLDSTNSGADRITTWKVFKIDEDNGEIQLVPTVTKTEVKLESAPGYNNAVQLLNEACRTLYSDPSKGIKAKSIDMDDIESLLDETKLQEEKDKYNHNSKNYLVDIEDEEYDQVSSAYGKTASYFPRIYEEEIYSVINGKKKTTGLRLSSPGSKLYDRTEASSLTDQTTKLTAKNGYFQANSSIQPYQTYYTWAYALTRSVNYKKYGSEYASILNGRYWVATRCVDASNGYCVFGIFHVDSGNIGRGASYNSTDGSYGANWLPLFPVVTLDTDLIEKEGSSFKVK